MPDQDRARFRGYAGPNYTQVPDELFDEQLPDLSGAELKVLLYIMRRTFGFKRESDNISISQMLNGLRARNGRQLDRGVGLSKKTLLLAIRSLEEQDIIMTERRRSVEKGDEPTTYRLNVLPPDTHDGPIKMASDQGHHEAWEESTPPVGEKVRHGGDVKTTSPVGGKLHQGGGEESTPPPWGRNSPTQYKERETQKEKKSSNFRKAPANYLDVEETLVTSIERNQDQTIVGALENWNKVGACTELQRTPPTRVKGLIRRSRRARHDSTCWPSSRISGASLTTQHHCAPRRPAWPTSITTPTSRWTSSLPISTRHGLPRRNGRARSAQPQLLPTQSGERTRWDISSPCSKADWGYANSPKVRTL